MRYVFVIGFGSKYLESITETIEAKYTESIGVLKKTKQKPK